MDEAHRAAYLRERYSSNELMEELDRRLAEQGIEPKSGGVKITVDYLREGWSVLALPPEMANQYDGMIGSGPGIHQLASELRRKLTDVQECDGCEENKASCVSVGEEVLCADCIILRTKDLEETLLAASVWWIKNADGDNWTKVTDREEAKEWLDMDPEVWQGVPYPDVVRAFKLEALDD